MFSRIPYFRFSFPLILGALLSFYTCIINYHSLILIDLFCFCVVGWVIWKLISSKKIIDIFKYQIRWGIIINILNLSIGYFYCKGLLFLNQSNLHVSNIVINLSLQGSILFVAILNSIVIKWGKIKSEIFLICLNYFSCVGLFVCLSFPCRSLMLVWLITCIFLFILNALFVEFQFEFKAFPSFKYFFWSFIMIELLSMPLLGYLNDWCGNFAVLFFYVGLALLTMFLYSKSNQILFAFLLHCIFILIGNILFIC